MEKKAIGVLALIFTAIGTSVTIGAIYEYNTSQNRIILATTTSTYDSGLLEYLIPTFSANTGIGVDVLSVGTGQAIATAKAGNADVLLVHARSREDDFVAEGYGIHRACIMYNDFVIVGPTSDPASIQGETSIESAMTKLKNAGNAGTIKFYSRGDSSGTYSKEVALWALIGFIPNAATNTWYLETGSGMGTTLTVTNENDGYTLIDRGTWLSAKENVDLTLLVEGPEVLLNPYGAILVNPEMFPHIKESHANSFIAFLVSEEGQNLIDEFRKNNEVLFHPAFGICDDTHSCSTTHEEVQYWQTFNGGYIGPSAATAIA